MRDYIIENAGLRDINPVLCGTEACAPGHSFGPATRTYYLLHYVVRGQGVFTCPRGSFPVGPGGIFVIRPGVRTYYEASADDPWEYIWIGFECGTSLRGVLEADVLDAPLCGELFQSALGCGASPSAPWLLAAVIYQLLAQLAALPAPVPVGPPAGPLTGRSGEPQRHVDAAISYICANYQADIGVGGIAAGLGLERSYFWRLFKQHTGLSPQQYIIRHRMQQARRLVLAGSHTLDEIAHETGYPDALSLSRMFKRHYGVSPRNMRSGPGDAEPKKPFAAGRSVP